MPRFPHILHGGDWNPDQWLHEPSIIEQDFSLMEKAGCNTFSVGIFAWATLEPAEGRFEFGWLDEIIDGLAKRGGTPSWPRRAAPSRAGCRRSTRRCGAIDAQGRREPHGSATTTASPRPCIATRSPSSTGSSPSATRHPALAGWHISNEYSGACYCAFCLAAFRAWLRTRYASLDALNAAYWSAFWSQTFQAWDQIDPRDSPLDALNLDWQRFTTHQTVDFMRNEVAPLKAATPHLPVTTNMMGTFAGLDYWRFAEICDRMAWDAYPQLTATGAPAVGLAMTHDMYRTMKGGLPFILMESTPSNTNWQQTPRSKRPGQHRQEMLLAIGHGADATMYFQWRKGRGAFEKIHGAVVDHEGSDGTRVFQDVAAHGALLRTLDAVVGTTVRPEVALVNDWEVRWALGFTQGPRQGRAGGTALRQGVRPHPDGPLPALLEAGHQRGRDREPLRLRSLPPHRRPHALHVEARRGRTARAFVKARRQPRAHVSLGDGERDEPGLPRRPAGGRPARAGRHLGRGDRFAAARPDAGSSPWRGTLSACRRARGSRLLRARARGGRDRARHVRQRLLRRRPALTVNRFGAGRVYYLAARPADDAFHDGLVAGLVRDCGWPATSTWTCPRASRCRSARAEDARSCSCTTAPIASRSSTLARLRLRDVTDGTVLTGRPLPPFTSRVVERA